MYEDYYGSPILPDDDEQADMYCYAAELLERYGYKQYEISNFCAPGYESRHNMKYWTLEDYMGFGPGAESQAHAPNEITWKQDLVTCAALYAAVPGLYKAEEKTEDATEFRQSLTDNDIQ